jgi:hypothetical protein
VAVGCNSGGIILAFVVEVNVTSLTNIVVRIVVVVGSGFCGLEFCESGYEVICGAIIDYRVRGRVS